VIRNVIEMIKVTLFKSYSFITSLEIGLSFKEKCHLVITIT